ncbi:MAG TPA: ESX-1 secretion-associated protein [Amycolatopsis sp.]|nr:ESX-1 secretion-associated protein [Amycolatopsis sp.]
MTSSFTVVSDELRAHASHLDGLVDRLNTAVSAANTVSMDNSSYGILCQFLPPIINALTQQHATDTLKSSVTGMSDMATNVRTAGSSYDQQDQAAAAPFQASLDGSGAGGSSYGTSSGGGSSYGSGGSGPSYDSGASGFGGGPGIELPPSNAQPDLPINQGPGIELPRETIGVPAFTGDQGPGIELPRETIGVPAFTGNQGPGIELPRETIGVPAFTGDQGPGIELPRENPSTPIYTGTLGPGIELPSTGQRPMEAETE